MPEFPFSPSDSQPNDVVRARLERFKADLRALDSDGVVQKHILMGDCYILDQDSRYQLCSAVAKQYGVRPERVYVVGSGQLGFSIADHSRYRPFSVDSDIDVAIVSEGLFDDFWLEVARYDSQNVNWPEQKRFQRYLMNGWIRLACSPSSYHL